MIRGKTKRFGVRDLARLAKVSVGTVDRALNGRSGINQETRERILDLAAANGYAPNPTARALSFSKSAFRIGVWIPREIHHFYDHLNEGVANEAKRYQHVGLEIVYRRVKQLSSPVSRAVNELLNQNVQAPGANSGQCRGSGAHHRKSRNRKECSCGVRGHRRFPQLQIHGHFRRSEH